ncbi:MAG: hypothetical protein Tsb0020_41990 [Haliangiales bacterium]
MGQHGTYERTNLLWRDEFVAEYSAVMVPAPERGHGGQSVTIKLLWADTVAEDGIGADFARDAARWRQLEHGRLRRLIDFGVSDGGLFICCEPFVGTTLSALAQSGVAAAAESPWHLYTAQIMADACAAAEAAYHAAGASAGFLIHGGISPHTILLGADGIVRLDDFGFARAHARVRSARASDTARTLPYLAPEQLKRSHALTPQVDVWSLGVCMWEMLTGRSLFRGDNDAATLLALTVGAVPPPSHIVPDLPPALDAILSRCIARDPSERYSSVIGMGDALRAFLDSHSVAFDAPALAGLVAAHESSDLLPVTPLGSEPELRAGSVHPEHDGVVARRAHAGGRGRYSLALGLLSGLLVLVTLAGAWIWQSRPEDAGLSAYQASRERLIDDVGEVEDQPVSATAGAAAVAPGGRAAVAGGGGVAPALAGEGDEGDDDGQGDDDGRDGRRAPDPDADEPGADDREAALRAERRAARRARRAAERATADSDGSQPGAADADAAAAEARGSAPEPARAVISRQLPESVPSLELPAPKPVPKPAPTPAPDPAHQAATGVRAAIADLNVRGGVARGDVKRAVERAVPSFRDCYLASSRRSGRSPSGVATIHLEIDESNRARVTGLEAPLSGMDSCLRQAASRIKSRTPPDVGRVRVSFGVHFTPLR